MAYRSYLPNARSGSTPTTCKIEITETKAVPYNDPKSAFVVQPANSWLQQTTQTGATRRLFGSFWFEDELSILFADTNVGKSILAVQIGESISAGKPVGEFELTVPPQPVLYFDFELSTKQFEQRYSREGTDKYCFSHQFYRIVPNHGCTGASRFKDYNEFISNGFENVLIEAKARILIIDNLSCLRNGTEGSASAMQLMQQLQRLKAKYKLSVLVLAHTPKRNPSRPITRNDLQGSKVLINFCDSAFAIGESQSQPGTLYVKQAKQRSAPEQHGAGQVCLCRIVKPHNFLSLQFTGQGHEQDHLLHYTEQHRKAQESSILQYHAEGLSYRQICAKLGISVATVSRVLKRMEAVG
jgi:hypothetical protein